MADWNTQRLAQALIGPRDGKLTPENEGAFQSFMAFDPNVRAWRNGFQNKYGEPPRMNDPSFDYRAAYTAGNKPQAYGYDTMPHWDSRGKAPDHPTAWMNDFMQQYGVDPNAAAQQPTTAQQGTINQQLSSDLLAQLLQRLR